MVIVIEGADRVGKSTLIKGLVKMIPSAQVLQFPSKDPPDHHDGLWFLGDMRDHLNILVHHYMRRDTLLILDRHWPSTCVYQNNMEWTKGLYASMPIDQYILLTGDKNVVELRMDPASKKVLDVTNTSWLDIQSKYLSLNIWNLILDGGDGIQGVLKSVINFIKDGLVEHVIREDKPLW